MPQQPQIRVVQAANAVRSKRITRRPQHRFNIKAKPFEIAPFLIAPVLPGETLTNLLMQSRVVSDPIQNPLIGWHKEYYYFYVPHRGLTASLGTTYTGNYFSDILQLMMLDPTNAATYMNDATWQATANSVPYYQFKGGLKFVEQCHQVVVNEWFRDEDQNYTQGIIENYPGAYVDQESWIQSLKLASQGADDSELPGVDELEELDILPGKTAEYAQWEMMRDHGLTDLTYEDYLRSYGVEIPKDEDQGDTPNVQWKPELIRFVRQWTYPTNHVEPTTGAPSSAVSWSIAERADKKRFFKEPGFLYGVTVTRPKIYLGSQKGAAVGVMRTYEEWLPAVLEDHPYISVTEQTFSATDGLLQNQASNYWLDIKDLFAYGDQFVNHAMTAAANHGLAVPSSTMDKRFVTNAMVGSLFKTAGSEYIKEDGVCHLNILSRVRDTTK